MRFFLLVIVLYSVAFCEDDVFCEIKKRLDYADSVAIIHTEMIRTLQKFVLLLSQNQICKKDISNLDSLLHEYRAPKDKGK